MKIAIKLDSIVKDGDKIFGNIFFEKSEFVFPERQWNDFVIIILNWWIDELLKLINNNAISAELFFMDGPLSIKVNHVENNYWLFFVHGEKIVHKEEVESKGFILNFKKELNSLIRHLNQKGLTNEEVLLLKENYKKLSLATKAIQ